MKAIVGLGLMVALGACGSSIDDVQSSPVALTVTVPAAWDVVGTCITQFYANDSEATYLPVPSEQRAKVIVKFVGPGIIQYKTISFIFEISGGLQTTVVVRQERAGWTDRQNKMTRDLIERCGALKA